uniref:Uncharacterized protein n=1 Tax=Hucho hucho TaxID=62062 RepID=A0A4W5PNR9_9TELE
MLLNRDPTDNISLLEDHPTSALFSAAQNGRSDCVNLLLTSGVSTDVSDQNGFTPLHFATAHGHHRCVEALVSGWADVDQRAVGGKTPLFMASGADRLDCTSALLNAGADHSRSTTLGTCGHSAAPPLPPCPRLHPHHDPNPDCNHSPGPATVPVLSSTLLNQDNCEGWTTGHITAARGFKVLGH